MHRGTRPCRKTARRRSVGHDRTRQDHLTGRYAGESTGPQRERRICPRRSRCGRWVQADTRGSPAAASVTLALVLHGACVATLSASPALKVLRSLLPWIEAWPVLTAPASNPPQPVLEAAILPSAPMPIARPQQPAPCARRYLLSAARCRSIAWSRYGQECPRPPSRAPMGHAIQQNAPVFAVRSGAG